jgi:tRNA(Ile)-lysidine synthase
MTARDDPPVDPIDAIVERCGFPPPGTPVVCAVSGGADSLALLVLAAAARCVVTAVHVDHGLRTGSAAEADVVAAAAAAVGASFRAVHVTVAPGANLEARARDARRGALPPGAATGHTMDDQAETVLVNLLRGAGVDGLAGMRLGPQHPLLGIRRAEAAALCRGKGFEPVADPSNVDPRFVRNRVRHELLPLACAVAGRDLVPVLARQAAILADEADLLDGLAAAIDPSDVDDLAAAPVALGRRAARRWLRHASGTGHPPDHAAVERVMALARGVGMATDVAPGRRVRRSGRTLVATSARRGGLG